jgi:AraC-like DNA-binding protein
MTGSRTGFEFSVRYRHLGLLGVELVRHSGHLEMSGSSGDHVHVVEVLQGRLQVAAQTGPLSVGAGGCVMTTFEEVRQVAWDDVRLVVVRMDRFELRRVAAHLAGVDPADLRFRVSQPASEGHARQWSAAVRYVIQGVLDNPGLTPSRLAEHEAFRLLSSTAIEAFPQVDLSSAEWSHVESKSSVSPATVRRGVDFIEANAHLPITVEDVARAARLSVRGTQAAFQRHLATTPAAYLRQVRLAGAHRDLLEADPTTGESVAHIAARWGFVHLGHFAASYRERYGVPPSHTLSR